MIEKGTPRESGYARVYAGLGAALVILTLLDLGGIAATQILDDRIRWQTHTYDVLEQTASISGSLHAIEAAQRGFILTGDSLFIREYDNARDSVRAAIARVAPLVSDNPEQRVRVDSLSALMTSRLLFIDTGLQHRVNGADAAAHDSVRAGANSALRANISRSLLAIEQAEKELLRHRTDRLTRALSIDKWISIGGLIASLALVLASVWLVRAEMERRRRSRAELAASEERLRDFLDSASDLIQSSAPDGRLLYANRALLRTLGYTEEEVIGKPSEMFLAPEEVEHARALFKRIMSGEAVTNIETIYIRKDGRRVHVAGSSNCRFENGRAVASRTILRDVTAQREVDHMKDEFVSIVSHELRTPLTSIRGALGLLAGGMLGEVGDRGKRMLDVAITNTDRLVRLINDILDVERIESGAVPMARRRTSLDSIMALAEEVVRPLADKAGVRLEVKSVDADLNADSDRMVQTLTNIIGNAIKFSPQGACVTVDAIRSGGEAHIRVRDEGRGIPSDKIETIFERFQQVDATDAREKGGSGLGLAISRSIVEQHDGRIWAESTLGAGSVFHMTLPLYQRKNEDTGETYPAPRTSSPLVLICDDDEDIRTVLGAILTERGYRVMSACDGETAVDLALEHRPAVVLLDLIMPGRYDGWATMAALKERAETRDIPIIIVSGSGPIAPAAQDGETNGAEKRMRKPVEAGSLVRAIEEALTQWGTGADVLVVEDVDDLARILVEFLRTHGLRPVHAADGREAVRLSQKQHPALILLDLMLPDTDGFAVVDWLRQHDRLRDVPIMVYTAHDLDEEQRARLDIAPELLFTKSRTAPEELVQRVAAMVGRMTWDQDQAES
jgi:PAS domain S-box-containing protein